MKRGGRRKLTRGGRGGRTEQQKTRRKNYKRKRIGEGRIGARRKGQNSRVRKMTKAS